MPSSGELHLNYICKDHYSKEGHILSFQTASQSPPLEVPLYQKSKANPPGQVLGHCRVLGRQNRENHGWQEHREGLLRWLQATAQQAVLHSAPLSTLVTDKTAQERSRVPPVPPGAETEAGTRGACGMASRERNHGFGKAYHDLSRSYVFPNPGKGLHSLHSVILLPFFP